MRIESPTAAGSGYRRFSIGLEALKKKKKIVDKKTVSLLYVTIVGYKEVKKGTRAHKNHPVPRGSYIILL